MTTTHDTKDHGIERTGWPRLFFRLGYWEGSGIAGKATLGDGDRRLEMTLDRQDSGHDQGGGDLVPTRFLLPGSAAYGKAEEQKDKTRRTKRNVCTRQLFFFTNRSKERGMESLLLLLLKKLSG